MAENKPVLTNERLFKDALLKIRQEWRYAEQIDDLSRRMYQIAIDALNGEAVEPGAARCEHGWVTGGCMTEGCAHYGGPSGKSSAALPE